MSDFGMPDFFGAPEYFANRVVRLESAGGDNVRLYWASIRGGELVPLYTEIMSFAELMQALAFIKQRATELWNESRLTMEVN
jgi:hypothetical protein